MSSLKGKVVIITGASCGIGEGIAVNFAKLGCRLSITGRNVASLARAEEKCKNAGCTNDTIVSIPSDINNSADRERIIKTTVERFGGIDVLINNVGMIYYTTVTEITEEEYDTIFNTNCKSHVFMTRLALPYIIKAKGNIIMTSSICGQQSMPEVGPYCMTKASLDMFTKCLALEMAKHGVRVNAILPGTVVSNIARREHGKYQDEELYQKFLSLQSQVHPLGRVGQPEDCAAAAEFLASDASSFITGQLLYVDGGRNCIAAGVSTKVKN